jgi:hypothetical protein
MIIDLFLKLLAYLGSLVGKTWDAYGGFLGFLGIFLGVLIAPFSYLITVLDGWVIFLNSKILLISSSVQQFPSHLSSSSSGISSQLAFVNFIVPLNDIISALALLITVWLLGIAYRLVKSFIPTLS